LSIVSHFTTDSYAAIPRLEAWRSTLAQFSIQVKDGRDELHGTVTSVSSPGGLQFGKVMSSPQEWFFQGGSGDALHLVLPLEGTVVVATDVQHTTIKAGDLLYCGPVATATLMLQQDVRLVLVRIPLDAVRTRLFRPSPSRVGHLTSYGGAGRVLARVIEAVADTMDSLNVDQIRPLDIALPELLVACLAEDETNSAMQARTSSQTATLHRIAQIMEARLNDPDLALSTVADEAGVSVRYLQKLFEVVGDSFSHYLRRRRLERCHADLINPTYAHLSITDICFRWGFNDAAHFSRAFRERYNMSPRACRAENGDAMARSRGIHMGRGWPDITHDVYKKLVKGEGGMGRHAGHVSQDIPPEAVMSSIGGLRHHYLPANDKTIHWGYFSHALPPVLEVESADFVTIETLSHHCGDDYERMIAGDAGAESVYHWTADRKTVSRRGAGPMGATVYGRGAGEGFGVHICTGPIAVKGAEPGDVIEVRILDLHPRTSASDAFANRAFGSNTAAWWGFHHRDQTTEPKDREVVTVYEIAGPPGREYAKALYNFRWTPQTDPDGVVHPTIDYPGICVDHTKVKKQYGVLKNIRIPVRPHFGVIALAPREADLVDSIPPSYFGGNIDDKRAGKGATLYLPVSVPGGLLSLGDPHASQGDGEVCGTALECSLTGTLQLILHKKRDHAGKPFAGLTYPLLETAQEWVVHGFTHANYLSELGQTAQSEIYKKSSLDPAMRDAFRKMRRFLMTAKGLSEDEAVSLMSVAVDFGITQVVDGNWCVHGILNKALFVDDDDDDAA